MEETTARYEFYKEKLLSELNLGDVMRLVGLAQMMADLVPEPNEIVDDAMEVASHLEGVLADFRVGGNCPHCWSSLYLSDLPQYDYVCYGCNENFYACEVSVG